MQPMSSSSSELSDEKSTDDQSIISEEDREKAEKMRLAILLSIGKDIQSLSYVVNILTLIHLFIISLRFKHWRNRHTYRFRNSASF